MEAITEKIFSLNLSEKYVPNWGAWEIGREIIANAIDADPEGYEVEHESNDCIIVTTSTWPMLKEIKIIGCGSKRPDSDTIGHFGEGFKMAALAACRKGGKISIFTPEYTAEFFMQQEDDERILAMAVKPAREGQVNGQVFISFPDIKSAISGRFIKNEFGPIPKDEQRANCRIYVRGVYMTTFNMKSLYDWNVQNASYGRDRNLVEQTTVNRHIAEWFNENMNDAMADQIRTIDISFVEMKAIDQWPEKFDREARAMLLASIQRVAGTDIVIATQNTTANKLAAARGKNVLVLSEGLARVMKPRFDQDEEGIKDSEQMLQTGSILTQAQRRPEWAEALKEIEQVIDLIEIPAEIRVFENFFGAEAGLAVMQDDRLGCIVWLNEALFLPGRRRERMATAIHELCHIRDKASDATLEFEKSLDTVGAIIALAWLEEKRSN